MYLLNELYGYMQTHEFSCTWAYNEVHMYMVTCTCIYMNYMITCTWAYNEVYGHMYLYLYLNEWLHVLVLIFK